MRRLTALVTTVALVFVLASTAVGTASGDYKDTFREPGYAGSDGSLEWSTDWLEKGEEDGPREGNVRAVEDDLCPEGSSCLYLSGNGLLSSVGAYRFADTSELDDLKLCYKIRRVNHNEIIVEPPVLHVQVSNGEEWVTQKTYELNQGDDSYLYESIGIGEFSTTEFGVRFVVTGLLPELEQVGVYIDYVWVEGHLAQSTTTTSSTTTTTTKSTTTTAKPTTTTTKKDSTTSTSSTTTTSTSSTTTTTVRDTTTTTGRDTTTTTLPETTTTTEAGLVAPPEGPPPDSGIRQAATGIQASFGTNAYGDVTAGGPDVLGVEFDADYTIAAEIIESSWVWMLGLVLLIATAIVSGMDRRRVGTSELPV